MDKTVLIDGRGFFIEYLDTKNKTARASITKNKIIIKLPIRWPQHERMKAADRLEKRIIKRLSNSNIKTTPIPPMNSEERKERIRNEMPRVLNRVNELNSLYFSAELGKIRIKSNLTNWGSCSIKNNISINFALLFLPQELLDYVMLHELAHTKIRNHSNGYWRIIEKIMPDYKKRKKELRHYILTN